MKRFSVLILAFLLLLPLCCACAQETPTEKKALSIVSTVFPPYDFARVIAGDLADTHILIPAGTDAHSYEPTPQDVSLMENCDLFLYIGGESDANIESILAASPETPTMTFLDCVSPITEEAEDEYDEHIWTSPKNAALMVRALCERLCALSPDNAERFRANAESYLTELSALDADYAAFFSAKPRTLVFGDRFPFAYLARDYGFSYLAAFPGCSEQTEPAASTVARMIEIIRSEDDKVIFYTESSNHLLADSLAEETGATTAMLHSCHNLGESDRAAGETYLSLMRRNLETLKAAFPS